MSEKKWKIEAKWEMETTGHICRHRYSVGVSGTSSEAFDRAFDKLTRYCENVHPETGFERHGNGSEAEK